MAHKESLFRTRSARRSRVAGLLALLLLASTGYAQQPIDVFLDRRPLTTDFVRVGAWNIQHFELKSGAAALLPGSNPDEDLESLAATYAKAIKDLGLDVAALVEHQNLDPDKDRLELLKKALNGGVTGPWRADETRIEYSDPNNTLMNLQFAVVWNSERIEIDPAKNTVLLELRQPKDNDPKRMRAPWLVPFKVKSSGTEFDLIVLHLKSGGSAPQEAEVDALAGFIRARLEGTNPRHTIVCGDWNIRPDKTDQHDQMDDMRIRDSSGVPLMRILTVDNATFDLDDWKTISRLIKDLKALDEDDQVEVVSRMLPRTHVRA